MVVNRLYYDKDGKAAAELSIGEEILMKALRNIYAKKGKELTYIEENLFREFCRKLGQATEEGFEGCTPDEEFSNALKHSNEVFAAFKVHRTSRDMAARLLDENGSLKPFEQWSKDVQPITSHQCQSWLHTEYNTAVLRAHQAADWQQFLREKDILPNLKWMPSTSPNPGADHTIFWGTVRPVEDEFWNQHRPGDRWNCKCTLTSTDEPATNTPVGVPDEASPQPGLTGNPGKDAAIFSDDHPYFPADCQHCDFYKPGIKARLRHLFMARVKDCYNCPYIDGCIPGTGKAANPYLEKTPINAKDDKEAFSHLKKEASEQMAQNGPVNMRGNQFYTKTMRFGKKEVSAILWHCFDEDEVYMAKELYRIIPTLNNGKYVPLNMSRRNYKAKIKEGVRHFVVYEIEHQGMAYELKCEAIKKKPWHRMAEFPYSLKKRKMK